MHLMSMERRGHRSVFYSMTNTLRPIVFTCPEHSIPVISGVLCETTDNEMLRRVRMNFQCPVCGKVHAVDPRMPQEVRHFSRA
jgi:hypothetical protein